MARKTATKTKTDADYARAVELSMRGATENAAAESAEATSRTSEVAFWSGLSPSQFGYLRRNFDRGDFRNSLPVFEKIMEADDRLLAVSQKRYESVSSLDYEIQLLDGVSENDPEALEQQTIVRDFFNTLVCSSVVKRDMKQGLSALISHLMTAICYGYAAATLELFPALTANNEPTIHGKATCVPLRFFEAKTRRLRLRLNYFDCDGVPLDPFAWIVCANPNSPLIVASGTLFALKSTPLGDWAHVVEKFGTPFVYAKTPAQVGDESWNSLVKTMRNVGSNFTGVFGQDVELFTQSVAQGNAPHEKIVDHLNRAIAILWRGGDVSTESKSGTDTVGGVSLQGSEKDARTKSDRILIEETLDTVTKRVVKAVFGDDAQPKVYFKFATDNTAEVNANIAKLRVAKEVGLAVPEKWTYSALNIPPPADEDATLAILETDPDTGVPRNRTEMPLKPQASENRISDTTLSNAGGVNGKIEQNDLSLGDMDELHAAQNAEWKEALEALQLLQSVPENDFGAALRAFAKTFPKIAEKIANRSDVASTMNELIEDSLREMATD